MKIASFEFVDTTPSALLHLKGGGIVRGSGRIALDFEAAFRNSETLKILESSRLEGNRCCVEPTSRFDNMGLLLIEAPNAASSESASSTGAKFELTGDDSTSGLVITKFIPERTLPDEDVRSSPIWPLRP